MICFAHEKILEISNSGKMPADLNLFSDKKDGENNF
jgi:hypothetical protein